MKRLFLAPALFLCVLAFPLVELFWATGRATQFGVSVTDFTFEPALLLITLTLAVTTNLYLFLSGHARQREKSSSTPLTPIDSVLSFLEPFLPARTMIEVAGDVREHIALLHDQGISPWKIRRQFAAGLLFILLDALRESLALRRKSNS